MTTAAAPLARAAALRSRIGGARTVAPVALRLLAFFALACVALLDWARLLVPLPTGRALAAAALATACGAALVATRALPRAFGLPLRLVLVVLMAALGVAAIGVPLELLLPSGWHTLSDRLTGGLEAVSSIGQWPYSGPNTWLRLTVLCAAPLAATLAAALAFWPLRADTRRASAARFASFALLLILYGVAVAARQPGHQGLRGLALLAAIAAWLWLPRLRGRDAVAAALVLAVSGAIALGLTAKLAADEPWVDYRHWQWTFHKEHTAVFDWRQTYGPIRWPRRGRTLLLVKSRRPYYWRAQVLDRFDGIRWTTDQTPSAPARPQDVVAPSHPGWTTTATVTLRGMRSQLVIAPGTPEAPPVLDSRTEPLADGIHLVEGRLAPGDTYRVRGYVPDPTVRAMRRAPAPDQALVPFTALQLPTADGRSGEFIDIPLRGVLGSGTRGAGDALEHSRYADVYRLARRVTAGARTNYDIVARIAQFLQGSYTYDERPPARRFPLEAFLLKDQIGYCQQFSGAAALMLRMLGVPTRVASGFSPGTLDKQTHEYVVRDLDAHAWIEVWFQGIGWVPFDPTPPVAPASSQSVQFAAQRSAHGVGLLRRVRRDLGTADAGPEVGVGAPGGGGHDAGTSWGPIALLAALATLVVSAVVGALRHRRRRRPIPVAPSGDPDVDHLLRLLARLGLAVEPGTTLLVLEQRLGRLGGPEAAAYARRLRERRFGGNGHPPPGREERRQIRRLLATALEAGPLTRLQVALPDRTGRGRRALKLVRP